MEKYSNGKIYKLQCDDGHFYIGSTVFMLYQRLGSHVSQSVLHPERKVYKHICTRGWDNVSIALVEVYPCENNRQLLRREQEEILKYKDNPFLLNDQIPNGSLEIDPTARRSEYYEANKEERRKYARENYAANREKKKQYSKQYYEANKDKAKAYYIRRKEQKNVSTTE